MVDSKNNQQNYETLNISIETIIGNSEMLRFVPHHLKTRKICKSVVKKLPFVVKFVPDRYKTMEMCDKVIKENGRMLEFIPDC